MPQLIRTTNDLITDSLRLLGELGVEEQVDAYMLSTGLTILNEILDSFSVDTIYIPYLTSINFTMVPNQAVYSFSDMQTANVVTNRIVSLEYCNYTVTTDPTISVNYPVRIVNDASYYQNVRQDGFVSRPSIVFTNDLQLESKLTFYPAPNLPYPVQLQVKVMLNAVTSQDTLNSLPPFYYKFLKFAMAREFLAYYPSGNWPPQNESAYQEIYNSLKSKNKINVAVEPSILLTVNNQYFWQNLSSYY